MPDHTETRTLDEIGRMVTTSGDDYGMNLVEAVRMWPTPRTTDIAAGRPNDGTARIGPNGERLGLNLADAVRLWPTPTSRDHKDTGDYRETREGRNSYNSLLGLAVGPTKTNGSLAPEFVEYLMGFPIGYTDCEPSGTR